MKPIPILGTLLVNRGDLLVRLFESIDYPVDEFIIIDNSGYKPDVKEAIEKIITMFPGKVNVHTPGKNKGVAGSWNWIFKNFDKPWYFIVGNDVQFTSGDMEKMVTEAWDHHETHGKVFGNQGHNAFITSKLALDMVGFYDENFYPAYLEDCDYMRRMRLAKVPYIDVPDCKIIHGEAPTWGSSTIYSNVHFRIMNGITHGNGYNYYYAKWGGPNDAEVYVHPFNDPTKSLKYWEILPDLRVLNDIWGI